MKPRLAFYDHHRQTYADQPLYESPTVEARFSVGFYAKDGGVWPGGEFNICLHNLSRGPAWFDGKPLDPRLSPRVCCFHDGFGALLQFERMGGLEILEEETIRHRDTLSRCLINLGLRDDSYYKLDKIPVSS